MLCYNSGCQYYNFSTGYGCLSVLLPLKRLPKFRIIFLLLLTVIDVDLGRPLTSGDAGLQSKPGLLQPSCLLFPGPQMHALSVSAFRFSRAVASSDLATIRSSCAMCNLSSATYISVSVLCTSALTRAISSVIMDRSFLASSSSTLSCSSVSDRFKAIDLAFCSAADVASSLAFALKSFDLRFSIAISDVFSLFFSLDNSSPTCFCSFLIISMEAIY